MKVSVIIPFHKTQFIHDAVASVQTQSYRDFEIVAVVNGEALHANLDWLRAMPEVRIVPYYAPPGNVGALKKLGFQAASGDILVELDHDDMLTPDCLEKVAAAFQEDDELGFVFSDCAHVGSKKHPFKPYGSYWGWESSLFDWRSQQIHRMHAFEADAGSLSSIHYAPDHVRAWRKTTYDKIGGHNADLAVLDDHELLIRTFLATKMKRLQECLYVYRHHDDNTSTGEQNAAIQEDTRRLFSEHGFKLIEREADLRGLRKIDLGGGLYKADGYESIDQEGGDITHDLSVAPWPLEDNSVGVLRASHVIEHLPDALQTMREAHRVLADGGWFMIEVPSTDGRGAWQDPTHCSFWNQNSFLYYTNRDQAQFIRNDSIRFQSFRCETHFPRPWFEVNNVPCVTAWLRAVKSDSRRPHAIDI